MPGVLRGVLYPRAGRSARRASIALNQNTIKYYQIWLRPPGPTEHSVDCGGQAQIGAFCTTFIEIRFSHLSRFPPSHSKQLTSWNITVFSFPPPFITSLCHHLPLGDRQLHPPALTIISHLRQKHGPSAQHELAPVCFKHHLASECEYR
jgi:hypothetical protein